VHRDLNVPYVKDEIKGLSQKYTDGMEEHPNILAINLMGRQDITQIKKKIISRCT